MLWLWRIKLPKFAGWNFFFFWVEMRGIVLDAYIQLQEHFFGRSQLFIYGTPSVRWEFTLVIFSLSPCCSCTWLGRSRRYWGSLKHPFPFSLYTENCPFALLLHWMMVYCAFSCLNSPNWRICLPGESSWKKMRLLTYLGSRMLNHNVIWKMLLKRNHRDGEVAWVDETLRLFVLRKKIN